MAVSEEVHTESSQPESATTLGTVVDLVRRIMNADVASIVSFSLTDHTVTWKAVSGFRSHVVIDNQPLVRPIANSIAQRLIASRSTEILEGIGFRADLPAAEFPVHAAEGVQAVAIAPIGMYGGLIAGYRSPHSFTDDERKLLKDLAEMAALALDNAQLFETATRSQSRMAGLIESAMDAVISVDEEQRIVLFNPAAESMFGCAAGEALGSSLEQFIPERFREGHRAHLSDFGQYGTSSRRMGTLGALSGIRSNGEEFPIEASISRSEIDGQKLFTVILRDITERRSAEDALRHSEELYRELFENANDIVYTHDLEGHVTSINKAGELLGGYSRAELMKMNMSDLLLPGSRQSADEMLQRKLSGQERTNYEVEIKVRDGRVLTLEISSRLIMKNGKPVGVQGIARDISDRKRTEDTLRQSEERAQRGQKIWAQTFDAIGEGILVYDKDKWIVRCNVHAAEMMEMQPEAVMGLSFSEAFARLFGKQAADYYLAESREGSSAFEVRTEAGRLNLVSIFPIEHPDGDSYSVVTLNDVTRLSEMQEQLGRTRRLASVGQLAAGVAHEINNPLAAITTCAEATMRDLRQTTEIAALVEDHQWNYYLEEIVRQALRCKEITRGLLDLTRQRRAQRVTCDLNLLVRQCAKVALQRAGSAIEFGIDLDNNVGQLATDGAMVRQILDNLLSNAIDAFGEKEGKLTVATTRDGDRIAIEVSDTGCGIPADSLARIFDPFFSMKGPGKGYGLGLAISSTLAESLGGAITVESKLDEGSRFSLWIPRRAPED
jgi:two-component system, cell cycle sensor histidine kinase and response regulator CckA